MGYYQDFKGVEIDMCVDCTHGKHKRINFYI